jgi:RNA polymerase sigma-70 factor (ECF subfamily)
VADSPGSADPSFADVYERYFDFVWSSARRLGVDAGALDDVVQEAFLIVHSRMHTLQRPDSLKSWIYGVVRRTVSNHHRTRRARAVWVGEVAYFDEARKASVPTPYEQTERRDRLRRLSNVMRALDEPKREVFLLTELEEMSAPEIAAALEIPLNTVYSRLRAARQAFELALARERERRAEEARAAEASRR